MSTDHVTRAQTGSTRRSFLQSGTAVTVAAAGLASRPVRGAEPGTALETVRLGLVGAGGRGSGAIENSMSINDNVKLVAIADVNARKPVSLLRRAEPKYGARVAVTSNKIHTGLDGYKRILDDPDVDLVLFATPPGFRPRHLLEAVEAGKHVFAEKPTCVDPAGYRICRKAHALAEANGTSIVTGTQYRRQSNYVESVNRIRDGAIGEVIGSQMRYCASGIWYRPRREGMSDTEYQIYNWMHFIWLSGDQIVEQAVHNIDTMNWIMGGPPEIAYGGGGRFTRPDDSQMWDNMAVDFVYPGNRMCSFMCRQVPNTETDNSNVIYGTDGVMTIYGGDRGSLMSDRDGTERWSMKGDIGAAYQQEHQDLVNSIVTGNPVVELNDTADSSLTAVIGRMAGYTGKNVTWDFAVNHSTLDMFPGELNYDGDMPNPPFAIPGKEPLV
ncbi:MAG: Gfo/Idh/MocA family oxidoreductase [Fuerstiella sp.]|nr:Gfo/Idh/MocA family oxidoreductase [Fuerstiella sp.]